ncbi:FHA domain-containing protein [Microbacterium jejuense]|uniref:FHA domain-containing protein n=1 Tax=Microbacterium jejuense TaxID=1263637 RepID=UPI0031F0560B
MPTLYAPGTTPVAVTPRGFAALEPGASAALLGRVRTVVADGRGLGGVIEALTGAYGTSLTAIPSFAVALVEGDAVRLAVRGDFAFDVEGGASERISGAGVTTWTERVIPGVVRVALQPGDAADASGPAELPVADAVVLASKIVWDAAAAPAGTGPVATPAAASAPPGSVPDPAPQSRTAARRGAEPQNLTAEPIGDAAAQSVSATVAPEDAQEPTVEPEKAPSPVTAEIPIVDPAPSTAGLIDSSAVHNLAGDETLVPTDSALSQPRPPAREPVAAPVEDPAIAATVIRGETGGTVAPAPAGDHDGATISLAQVRAMRAGAAGAAGAASTTTTPPPLAPPRPPAPGRIRVSSGQVVLLDRTVVIGRRPRSTRVSGTDLPHLVAVDSPQQDISRSHVELRVEGESIVATDLRTTNGTTLLRAGSDPVRLHPGEATVVIRGDVLDLGDGITVAIEGVS